MAEPDQIIAGYQRATKLLRARILQLAGQAWSALGSYRDADIDRLVAFLVPRVQAGQLQVANLTAAYLASLFAAVGTPAEPTTVDQDAILNARGVPADEVYRRPANELYTALAGGKPFDAAVALGATRLASLVSTDLQMAKVRQADASLRRSGATYYQRVLNAPSCAKCIITSTRRYKVGHLLPIHPGCDCGIREIKESDPPVILDKELLDATHEQVKQFAGEDFQNASAVDYQEIIVDREHGEIGPVLTWRNQNFTGPNDI